MRGEGGREGREGREGGRRGGKEGRGGRRGGEGGSAGGRAGLERSLGSLPPSSPPSLFARAPPSLRQHYVISRNQTNDRGE